VIIPLYGYFEGDFLGLAIVALADQKVGDLAEQLSNWVLDLRVERLAGRLIVLNEHGEKLDLDSTVAEAGLAAGDLFFVQQVAA
jgi:hypothetical protein